MFLGPNSRVTGGVAARRAFPAGTQLAFINVVAPLGWVRVSTYDDALLRIVGSATPSSGGSNNFSTVNAQTGTGTGTTGTGSTGTGTTGTGTSGSTTLTSAQIPALSVSGTTYSSASGTANQSIVGGGTGGSGSFSTSLNANASGGGGSHNHTVPGLSVPALSIPGLAIPSLPVSFGIKYVDVLIARKS
jgi:hypothetical protein